MTLLAAKDLSEPSHVCERPMYEANGMQGSVEPKTWKVHLDSRLIICTTHRCRDVSALRVYPSQLDVYIALASWLRWTRPP